ncbi:MAG: hypothetical protein Q9209_002698 [Squamulea sp. 1 TL-2023]
MTSDYTGIQWVPKPLNQSSVHAFKQPTKIIPPVTGTENRSFRSDAEPALKKQRLDGELNWSPVVAPSVGTYERRKNIQSPHSQVPAPSDVQTNSTSSQTANQSNPAHLDSSEAPSLVFPLRSSPNQHQVRKDRHNAITQRVVRNVGAVQTNPFILEPPSAAPRYAATIKSGNTRESFVAEPKQVAPSAEDAADFLPWRGTHAEDVLGEFTIKNGFYDKIQVSQHESSTAKPTVWRMYKQQSALDALSSLFVSVLDQRQIHGSITAGCTFKPPPRVTLTDSKREAWLRDLANPTTPLRRLSRTIPHGIRGRVLLDHSLAKNIPTSRSIWLAKCVGANEIRAFKRKGASGAFALGGESKWIKDWTANVEQFLDALISTCGCDEWRDNMTYGLRLATHLFAERLLDKDHYFDWLLNAINQVDLETLPVYLLIIRSHLKDFGQSRRYGRRLAESLLEQLQRVEENISPDLYDAVKIKISNVIRLLIVASPVSFLMRRWWPTYHSLLQTAIAAPQAAIFKDLCKRNKRLQAMASLDAESEAATSQSLVQILDSMSSGADIPTKARTLWEIALNPELLVRTCLCWASSIHGTNYVRVYTAARLLRSWSGMDVDIESQVLHFLAVNAKEADLERASLYRIIAELVRSRHFSVSPTIGLLVELPSHGLPAHILNLRQNLLRSVGVSGDDENRKVSQWKALFDHEPLDQHQGLLGLSTIEHLPSGRGHHSFAVKLSVGHWIRQKLLSYSETGQAPIERPQDKTVIGARPPLHPILDISRFGTVLALLEDLEDFTTLADFLLFHSKSHDPRLLTAITVTVNHYLDIFLACGIADTIFVRMMQRHSKLNDQPCQLALLEALVDLAESLPKRLREARVLRKEVQRHESKLSAAVCSPISEHMAEALQIEDPGSSLPCTDDIEQLLASGTTMDRQLLTDVFGVVWKRFEIACTESVQTGYTVANLIARLRSFDAIAVKEMTVSQVDNILASRSRVKPSLMWISLVCARVLSFEKLLSRILQSIQQADDPSLQLRAESSLSHLYYRFYTQQQQALRGFSPSAVSLLQHTIRQTHSAHDTPSLSLRKLLQDPAFMTLLRTFTDSSQQGGESIREVFDSIITTEQAVRTLGNLALPSAIEQQQGSPEGTLSVLLDNVTTVSMSLCRLYLEAILASWSKTNGDTTHMLVHVMLEMLPFSLPRKIEQWAGIVSGLPQQQRHAIGGRAETEIFALLGNTPRLSATDLSKQLALLLSLVSAADKTAYDSVSATSIITQVHHAIAHLSCSHLSSKSVSGSRTQAENPDMSEELLDYEKLYGLLRLLHIHQNAFSTPNVSEDALTQILVQLGLLLVHSFPSTYAYLVNDICDLLTVISDSLSLTIQTRCIRILQKQHRLKDSRLHYIFSSSDDEEDTWLQLSTGIMSSTQTPTMHYFPIRTWETMQDATPLMTENDTSISLSLFGARKSVL